MISRIWCLIKIELFKIAGQKLFYLAVAIILLTLIGSIFLSPSDSSINSFTLLTRAVQNSFKIAAFFVLILGCLSISSETTAGTIKTILINPIRRSELFIAKALAIVVIAFAVALLIELLSFSLVWITYGFSDIADPTIKTYIHLAKADMLRFTAYTFALIFLPFACVGLFGLFISSFTDNAGIAVALGILFYLFLDYFIRALSPGLAPYLFSHYLDAYTAILSDLSEGVLGRINRFDAIDYLLGAKQPGEETVDYLSLLLSQIIPLGYMMLFFITGLWALNRKEII